MVITSKSCTVFKAVAFCLSSRVMKLLTSVFIICGLATFLLVEAKIHKEAVLERLREHFYGNVDAVDWSPIIKEYVVDDYLKVPTPILRMNHVLNYITDIVNKTEAVQLAKEKALKAAEIAIKVSMQNMGKMINKWRYRIIQHFQDKEYPIVTTAGLNYLESTQDNAHYTTALYDNDTLIEMDNAKGYSKLFQDYTIDWE